MNFQMSVITSAICILIIMLVFISYILYTDNKNIKFPPVIGECPDYWVSDNSGCTNLHNLGKVDQAGCMAKDFSTDTFSGHDSNCLKSKWAINCELSWQGITDNPKICELIEIP